jgi:nicotinamide riboside transporter PnuC
MMSDWSSDLMEQELRMDAMRADIRLKTRQANTEVRKTLATVLGASATIFTAAGVIIGYAIGLHH